MPGATLANTLDLLQDKFTKRLRSQTHDRTQIWNRIPRADILFDGQQVVGLLATGYPASGGGRGPGAELPVATYTTLKRYRIVHTYQYHRIQIDWDLQEQSRGPASWIRGFLLQQDRVRAFVSKDFERQICGDGSGKLGEISSVASAPIYTLTDRYDTVNFELGMRIDIVDQTGSAITEDSTSQITSPSAEADFPIVIGIDPNNGTITLDQTPTGPANTDAFIKYGALRASGSGATRTREMYGIDAIISDDDDDLLRPHTSLPDEAQGTFQGIDADTDSFWRSQLVDAGSGTLYLSPDMIQDGIVAIQIFGAEASDAVEAIYCHPLQEQKYHENIRTGSSDTAGPRGAGNAAYMRYPVTGGPWSPHGEWQGAAKEAVYSNYNGIPIICSRYFRKDRAWICSRRSVEKYILSDFHFVPGEGGGIIHKDYGNRASFVAETMFYGQCGTELRNASVAIIDLDAADWTSVL
jgi:hypothetical protein